MEKIVILSFLFLACVVLRTSGQNDTTSVPPTQPDITPNATAGPDTSSSVAPSPTATEPPQEPTSGAVNVKTLAGFVASFVLIALF